MAQVQQEIESLKETLQTQQKLLYQLYTELEAEREASSSAASEALSMILRLQEEKASCQLEACQFKRLTEEKMNHADELQHAFQEIMHKKELEIASLECQLKAYHYKLLSLGISESQFPETDFIDSHYPLSRMQSLPALSLPQITVEELSPTKADQHPHPFYFQSTSVPKISPPVVRDLASHWEQIKELDERVRAGLSCRIPSTKELRATTSVAFPDELQPDLDYSDDLRTYSCSTSQVKDIHDVFEVPQNKDNRFGKPDPFPNGTIRCCCRDEAVSGKTENRWTKQSEGANLNSQLTLVGLTNHISPVQTDFQQLNQRLEKLEIETRLANQQVSGPNQENLRLLKEIREKLDAIQVEITSTTHGNRPAADETSLVSLMEAMFFYSL